MKADVLLSIFLRLLLALFVGGLIGVERQISHKPAGLRTHMLVSFGSALSILATLYLSPSESPADTSRTIQGIAAGIGFLGGGEILRYKHLIGVNSTYNSLTDAKSRIEPEEVHKLTSATAIWVSAALGTLAGCGLWEISLLGAPRSYAVLKAVKKVEKYL